MSDTTGAKEGEPFGSGEAIGRRRFLQLGGAAALATGAAAVLGGGSSSAAARSGAAARSASTARASARSGVLSIAVPNDPASLDPVRYNDGPIRLVYSAVVEPVYTLTEKHGLNPVLAAGPPKVNHDYTRFEVPIRSGVKFHNGKTLTSKDVKFTVEQITNPKNASQNAPVYPPLASVETPDDHTIVFTLKAPYKYFLETAMPFTWVVPSNVRYDATTYAAKLIGTGPFRFVSWHHSVEIVLKRNTDYWQRGLPYLAGVQYQIIPTEEAQVASLRNGGVQMIPNLPPNYASVVRSSRGQLYLPSAVNNVDWLWPNWSPGHPTSDQNLRLAISYAINRSRIVKEIYKNLAKPETTVPSRGTLGYSAKIGGSINPQGDPAAAKKYLRAAGGPPSKPLVFIVETGYNLAATECELVQEDLQAIGIQTAIQPESEAAAFGALAAGAYDLFYFTGNVEVTPNQASQLDDPGSTINLNHVDDPKLTALANDAANNAAVVRQLQKQVLATVPQIPLVTYPPIFGLSKSVQDFVATESAFDLFALRSTKLAAS